MFDPTTTLPTACRIHHPVTGTLVFVPAGVSFGDAVATYNLTTLGYTPEGDASVEPDPVAIATFPPELLAQLQAQNVTKLEDPNTGKEVSLADYLATQQ